jgi:hypothetical protein
MTYYPKDIYSYTFVSNKLNEFEGIQGNIWIAPTAGFPFYKAKIYGV